MTSPERLAPALRDAVLAVPGVVRLAPGGPIEAATYFAGGRVVGVRLSDPVEVHIVVDRLPVVPIAGEVHAAARRVLDGSGESCPVEVVVDDFEPAALTAVPGR
jgi:hypothetical protein